MYAYMLTQSRWFVDAPEDVAKERVVLRHLAAGIESTRTAAEKRVESNDILNGRHIREKLIKPDLIISN
jgi:pantothenate kinase